MNVEIGAEAELFPEKEYISGIFAAVQVIPADDLLAAKLNSSYTEILAAYSGWGAMHSNSPSYIRMALTLADKMLNSSF
jgi:hypothetical protein